MGYKSIMSLLKAYFDQNSARFETKMLLAVIFFDVLLLWFCASYLSISYYEAKIYFNDSEILSHIVKFSTFIFGQNDFGLRLPMVIFHVISIVLLYNVSKFYLSCRIDRIFSVILFILLPGTIASAVVVNDAGLCIMLTLLMLYLFHIKKIVAFYILLVTSVFIGNDFLAFYLALFIFALIKKDALMAWLCATLFAFSIYFFGFDTNGKPSGHFVDTFGIFAAVFSPFVFFYFVYTLYRIWVKESKNLLWFVCVSAFCFCMIVSLRQRLNLEAFLPFCVIATPLMIRMFMSAYRVRLPKFRKRYRAFGLFIFISLLLNYLVIVFNPIIYKFINEPKNHFVYKLNIARELSKALKSKDIYKIYTQDEKLALRLKFYGIESGKELRLTNGKEIVIKRFGKEIAGFKISKR